jgi:hypothetical protein
MEASFAVTQERARAEGGSALVTSSEEIEELVADAIRKSPRDASNTFKPKASRR